MVMECLRRAGVAVGTKIAVLEVIETEERASAIPQFQSSTVIRIELAKGLREGGIQRIKREAKRLRRRQVLLRTLGVGEPEHFVLDDRSTRTSRQTVPAETKATAIHPSSFAEA